MREFFSFNDKAILYDGDSPYALVIHRGGEDKLEIRYMAKEEMFNGQTPSHVLRFEELFGFYELISGPYVALVLEAEQVVAPSAHSEVDIRKAAKMVLVPLFKGGKFLSSQQEEEEDRLLELLHSVFVTHEFYFSRTFDITHTMQRAALMDGHERSSPLWARADNRFFWNKDLLTPLGKTEAVDDWVVPMMSAYVDCRECSIEDVTFNLLFISRRSRYRQGTRFTKRGIDKRGNVANFVETEQVLLYPDGSVTALVQIRGSIPIYWDSPVHMKYAPIVHVQGDEERDLEACQRHVEEIIDRYQARSLLCVCLVDKKKSEAHLGRGFGRTVGNVARKLSFDIEYEWFDFHKECSKMKWHNLSKLIDHIDGTFREQGFFYRGMDGRIIQTQTGVVRTNCMDNLDRTNVVQSLLGRRSLLIQLNKTAALKDVLESPYREFELTFKDVWGNNADAMSMLYAGTGALKTDFTRTGKRTTKGALKDGYNSVMRYYLNNLVDGRRQDAIDLHIGRFLPAKHSGGLIPPPSAPLATFMLKHFVILIAIFSFFLLLFKDDVSVPTTFLRSLLLTFLILLVQLYMLTKKGTKEGQQMVVRPFFLPDPPVIHNPSSYPASD